MKLLVPVLALFSLASHVSAHFTLQYLWVNGADQGYNNGWRVPPNNNPVTDVTSTDLTCNVNGLSGAGVTTIPITAGSNLTLEWHQHAQRTGEDAISSGHKGPAIVYVAKAPSDDSSFNGQGAVWTKVWQQGLVNSSTQEWATDIINANNGKHSFIFPKSLPNGNYLIRGEIIALHVASTYPGAQFYIGCAQVSVTGGGSASPTKISLPGAYKSTDPGITINIYNNLKNYTVPGGSVWSG